VLGLVRFHGLPANFLHKPHAAREVIRASLTTRLALLATLAEADHRGRVCKAGDNAAERVALFPEFCREWECWGGPRAFANDHSRFVYFRTESAHPTLHLFDDSKCEVTVLCGLPGSGKSTWAAASAGDHAVITLDDIRAELDVDPGDADQSAVVVTAYGRARELLRRGEPFVWNATNVTRLHRGKLIDLAAAYKARVRVVYLEPPIPVIRQRNRGRAKAVPERVWDRMFDRLDVPTPAEAHRV
jgi:predicted kinase